MFAKRRANVLICSLVLSINFVRWARIVLLNPALRKHFSVGSNSNETDNPWNLNYHMDLETANF
jgi:hypothetical protein